MTAREARYARRSMPTLGRWSWKTGGMRAEVLGSPVSYWTVTLPFEKVGSVEVWLMGASYISMIMR